MGHGGARKNSGAKLGSTQKIPRAEVAKLMGPEIVAFWQKMLKSKNKADRKWAAHEAAPFAIQKQPTALEGNTDGAPIRIVID